MNYIPVEKLIAEIERQQRRLVILSNTEQVDIRRDCALQNGVYTYILGLITALQQEQPDFDDVDPKHLVHSHYTKVRETKTGRVFWAEYSSEAAEWYEAGTGKAYSISDVEIVKEQPKEDLVAELKHHLATTPKEQLEKEWKELEPWGNIGPTVQEFLYGKQPEVDLEKEIGRTYHDRSVADTSDMDHVDYENIAHYFYELGLNARKK